MFHIASNSNLLQQSGLLSDLCYSSWLRDTWENLTLTAGEEDVVSVTVVERKNCFFTQDFAVSFGHNISVLLNSAMTAIACLHCWLVRHFWHGWGLHVFAHLFIWVIQPLWEEYPHVKLPLRILTLSPNIFRPRTTFFCLIRSRCSFLVSFFFFLMMLVPPTLNAIVNSPFCFFSKLKSKIKTIHFISNISRDRREQN